MYAGEYRRYRLLGNHLSLAGCPGLITRSRSQAADGYEAFTGLLSLGHSREFSSLVQCIKLVHLLRGLSLMSSTESFLGFWSLEPPDDLEKQKQPLPPTPRGLTFLQFCLHLRPSLSEALFSRISLHSISLKLHLLGNSEFSYKDHQHSVRSGCTTDEALSVA